MTTQEIAPPQTPTVNIDIRTGIAIALTVFCFASAFAAGRAALKAYTPEHVALLRFLLASAALIGIAVVRRIPLPRRADLPGLAFLGFAGFAFYNIMLNNGQKTVSAGASSLIVNISPLIVAVLAGILYRERQSKWVWIGFGISLSGVAVIAASTREGLQFSTGILFLIGAACSLAVYSVGQKRFLSRYTPLQFLTYAIWSGTLFLLIFLPGLGKQIAEAPAGATFAVFYLAIVTSVIGYGSWSYVLSRLPASRAGGFLYLNPAVAIVVAWIWLGEMPLPITLLGGALVLSGVILANWRR